MKHELVSKLQAALPQLGRDLIFSDVAAELLEKGTLFAQEYHQILSASSESGQSAILVDILAGKEDAAYYIFLETLRKDYDWLAGVIENNDGESGDVTDSVPINRARVSRQQRMADSKFTPESSSSPGCSKPTGRGQKRSQSTSGEPRKTKRCRLEKEETDTQDVPGQRNTIIGASTCAAVPNNISNERRTEGSVPSQRDPEKLSAVGLTEEMMHLVKKNHRTSRDWTTLAHALGLSRLINKIRVKVLVFGEDWDGCVVHLLQEWAGEKPKDANLQNLLSALRGEGFNDVADELLNKYAV